ncbi:sporulation protein [Clostridium sp. W14A]|uniref:SpoIIIAH-like family protein n=1 Tax=Caproicibacter fermentans TaxID=2576756 RepID=A0A7G8TCB4_9FIRM|nr:SpoIIIAH-like family protein [Caproicibacter fermentans]OCN02479.1 sporulation protein [Clostridium sp. W14A]QNK41255.1 SpoIIIAH-like family protein [Caproicibacter fermentans]
MTMGKRQLVLASLVVALGAAVYLNWALSGNTQLSATNAVTSGRELGETLLVNASGNESGASSGENSSAVDTSASVAGDDYFASARLTREKARDESVEMLQKVVSGAGETDAAKQTAVSQANTIAQNIVKEAEIENLIKAKGFDDCVVFLQNEECSVVVKTKTNTQNDAIVVRDIVADQAGISYDKIKIVECE